MTKRQDLCLRQRSRPEQSDQRQPNQAANISHQPRASPNSTPLTSRIEFPTMTEPEPDIRQQASSGMHCMVCPCIFPFREPTIGGTLAIAQSVRPTLPFEPFDEGSVIR